MHRLRDSRLVASVRGRLQAGDAVTAAPESTGSTTNPANANLGSLSLSNAALGDADGGKLCICVTTLGDEALLSALGDVRSIACAS
jgi:hypothetical protein